MYSSGDKRGGFTITELLVVMGIAATLLAMGFPAVRAFLSHRKNDVLVCTLHLQRIGQAVKAYQLDYGCVPPKLGVLLGSDYIRNPNVLHCPADESEMFENSYEANYHWTLDIPEGDPDEHMQLSLPEPRRHWYPDDYVVITRCNRHEDELVLTWGGDVESITAD